MSDWKQPLRLVELLDKKGNIEEKGIDKLVDAVQEASDLANNLKCDELLAFATSAVRSASNSDEVLKRVEKKTGVKLNILRMLVARGCRLTVVPAQTPASDVLSLNPDGVFLSNGPGDPEPCDYAIKATAELIEKGIPTFGICLGHQIMALASGAKTLKMKFGHHGANHPVQDLDSKKVLITSQNHGFAVDPETLPENCRVTHVSLFDGSNCGLRLVDRQLYVDLNRHYRKQVHPVSENLFSSDDGRLTVEYLPDGPVERIFIRPAGLPSNERLGETSWLGK